MPLHVVLLDNEDSFVWNLAQAYEVLGARVTVRRSDRIDVAGLRALAPTHVVLSPGPGRPEDAGVCVEAVRALTGELPLLGVCLGHQAIAVALGAAVVRGRPCHGKAWTVQHGGDDPLLAGLPRPFAAARYHSLTVAPDSLPPSLRVLATTPQGEVMMLRHAGVPTWGVQFHPESFRTPHGPMLLAGFLAQRAARPRPRHHHLGADVA